MKEYDKIQIGLSYQDPALFFANAEWDIEG